jgi:hypothetical protein
MSSIVIAKFWPVIVGLCGMSGVFLLGWVRTKPPKHKRP